MAAGRERLLKRLLSGVFGLLLGLFITGLLLARPILVGLGWIIDLSTGAADLTVYGHTAEHIGLAVASGDVNGDGPQRRSSRR